MIVKKPSLIEYFAFFCPASALYELRHFINQYIIHVKKRQAFPLTHRKTKPLNRFTVYLIEP